MSLFQTSICFKESLYLVKNSRKHSCPIVTKSSALKTIEGSFRHDVLQNWDNIVNWSYFSIVFKIRIKFDFNDSLSLRRYFSIYEHNSLRHNSSAAIKSSMIVLISCFASSSFPLYI
jgi:hypothetical protein